MAKNRILLAHQAWITFLKIKSAQNLETLRKQIKKSGANYKTFANIFYHNLEVPGMTLDFAKEYILCKEEKEIHEWAKKISQDFSPQGRFSRLTFSEKISLGSN